MAPRIEKGAIVCEGASIEGNVIIGPGCVIHPASCIQATKGTIVLGARNVIEEKVVIRHDMDGNMIVGDENIFKVGCSITSSTIGKENEFGMHSMVNRAVVSDCCYVGPKVRVGEGASLRNGVSLVIGSHGNLVENAPFPGPPPGSRAKLDGAEREEYLQCMADPHNRRFLGHYHELMPES